MIRSFGFDGFFMRRLALLCALLAGASAYALTTARIELPEPLAAQAERLPISGFGGYNKGSFEMPGFQGEFTRGESRLGLFNSAFVSNKGRSSFTLRESSAAEVISAECEFTRKVVTIDIVTFDPKKLSYQCEFRRDGNLLGARLVAGHPKARGFKEQMLAREARRGESNIFGQHILIESLHKYEGSKIESSAPIGYVLTHEGLNVAALELTDVNPTLIVSTELQGDLRHSVIAAALALAVLRDPANSALED